MITSRYTFGGDEHLFVECSEEMSLEAFFHSLSLTTAIREKQIEGISEICPSNASLQLKFNPDIIAPERLLKMVQDLEAEGQKVEKTIATRIIEVPVLYGDPWTEETLMRFRDRHQSPDQTDLEYAARINHKRSVKDFIKAHSGAPWFVTMVGFVAGLPFMYQMVERAEQLQVPKYLRPRTDTPKLTLGHGGCFSCIYSVRGAGGYQMFGITPMPIYDPDLSLSYFKDFMIFFRPGDIVKFNPITRNAYDTISEAVTDNRFVPKIQPVLFDFDRFKKDIKAYNKELINTLYK